MQTFQQFFLSESHLPYIRELIDFLTKHNYIQKIIKIGKQNEFTGKKFAPVGAIAHFNPYTKSEEVIDIYLDFRRGANLGSAGKAKRKVKHGKEYWFIILNWTTIMTMQTITNTSLEELISGRLHHEISHAVDPSPRSTKISGEIDPNNNEMMDAYLTNQGEINSRIADTVSIIRKMLQDKKINEDAIKFNLRKPKTSFVFWLSSINPLIADSLQHYMSNQPDIIQKMRQVIYNELFNTQTRNIPPARKVRSKFNF